MRRLLFFLSLMLVFITTSAVAETALDERYVGSWRVYLEIDDRSVITPSDVMTLHISKTGQVSSGTNEAFQGTLVFDPSAGVYMLGSYRVTVDDIGSMYLQDTATENAPLLVCRAQYSYSYNLPVRPTTTFATSGEWQLRYVKFRTMWLDYPWFEVSQLGIAPLTVTFPAHATTTEMSDAIKALFRENRQVSHVISTLNQHPIIDSLELVSDGVLVATLSSSYTLNLCEVCFTRTQTPDIDDYIAVQARELMGQWIISGITLSSGLTLPTDSMREDYLLLIDDYGNVKLGDEFFHLTKDASRTPRLLLQSDIASRTPLRLDTKTNSITILDPVSGAQLRFISYAEAYWQDLCGTWEINCIQYENIGLKEFPDDLDFTLTLAEDYTAKLCTGALYIPFNVITSDQVDQYTLKNADASYSLECIEDGKTIIVRSNGNGEILVFTRQTKK